MSDRSAPPELITTRFEGPAPEVAVSTDMIKRGLVVAPVLIAVCGVIWGMDGVWSSAYGIAIVLANFALAAASIASAASDGTRRFARITVPSAERAPERRAAPAGSSSHAS